MARTNINSDNAGYKTNQVRPSTVKPAKSNGKKISPAMPKNGNDIPTRGSRG